MPFSQEFLEFVLDQLSAFGEVDYKKMFGGVGIYHAGIMFALIANDELYLRADEINKIDYENLGLEAFKPYENKPGRLPYFPPPIEVIEQPKELEIWAAKAFDAALRNKKKSK